MEPREAGEGVCVCVRVHVCVREREPVCELGSDPGHAGSGGGCREKPWLSPAPCNLGCLRFPRGKVFPAGWPLRMGSLLPALFLWSGQDPDCSKLSRYQCNGS